MLQLAERLSPTLTGDQAEAVHDALEPLRLFLGILQRSYGFDAPMDEIGHVAGELLDRAASIIEGMRSA